MMKILLSAIILSISLEAGMRKYLRSEKLFYNILSAHGIKCYLGNEDLEVKTDCPNESYCSKITVSGGGQDTSGLGCGSATNGLSNDLRCSTVGDGCKENGLSGIKTEACCCKEDL